MTAQSGRAGRGAEPIDLVARTFALGDRARNVSDEPAQDRLRLLAQQAETSLLIREREHDLEVCRRKDEHDLRMHRRHSDRDFQYQVRLDELLLKQRRLDIEREGELHRLRVAREWVAVARRIVLVVAGAMTLYWCAKSGVPGDVLDTILGPREP